MNPIPLLLKSRSCPWLARRQSPSPKRFLAASFSACLMLKPVGSTLRNPICSNVKDAMSRSPLCLPSTRRRLSCFAANAVHPCSVLLGRLGCRPRVSDRRAGRVTHPLEMDNENRSCSHSCWDSMPGGMFLAMCDTVLYWLWSLLQSIGHNRRCLRSM